MFSYQAQELLPYVGIDIARIGWIVPRDFSLSLSLFSVAGAVFLVSQCDIMSGLFTIVIP